MKILRVHVPAYRVLKDVDISFEPDFVPNIFPLGSQNGGGKSTLLQLLFTFLSYVGKPNNFEYLRNMLALIKSPIAEDNKLVISVTVLIEKNEYEIDLLMVKKDFLNNIFNTNDVPLKIILQLCESEKIINIMDEFKKHMDINNFIIKNNKLYVLLGSIHLENQLSYIIYSVTSKKETLNYEFKEEFFKKLTAHLNKIFLFSPLTQICFFLKESERKLLLNTNSEQSIKYASCLAQTKEKIPNFFTYDFAAEELFIKAIKAVRDKDFAQAIESNGESYGKNYKNLLEIFKTLSNKVIKPSEDLSSISFNLIQDQQPEKQISITDLSHGELKRLSILIWLVANEYEDAVILMDELEIGFHPDWQYQIIKDLQKWGPKNQYIIATHSYEICEALTPKHVKILDPKLPAKI